MYYENIQHGHICVCPVLDYEWAWHVYTFHLTDLGVTLTFGPDPCAV